eukprot:comp23798_c0_seq1/m.41363 comp23798_c0_seq1/g.41363  ORF comp23798_c0_seq1/g.41363 comp23798_c0_seq1/m.41363 type:complete len:384 (-) comp23798_c0_seq1:99-1250(-)
MARTTFDDDLLKLQHKLKECNIGQGGYCAACDVFNPDYACTECGLKFHQRCHDTVKGAKVCPRLLERTEFLRKHRNNPNFHNVINPRFIMDRPFLVTGAGLVQRRHEFKSHTYKKPTQCTVCKKLLTGIFKQGYRCTICRINCHEHCRLQDPQHCEGGDIGLANKPGANLLMAPQAKLTGNLGNPGSSGEIPAHAYNNIPKNAKEIAAAGAAVQEPEEPEQIYGNMPAKGTYMNISAAAKIAAQEAAGGSTRLEPPKRELPMPVTQADSDDTGAGEEGEESDGEENTEINWKGSILRELYRLPPLDTKGIEEYLVGNPEEEEGNEWIMELVMLAKQGHKDIELNVKVLSECNDDLEKAMRRLAGSKSPNAAGGGTSPRMGTQA